MLPVKGASRANYGQNQALSNWSAMHHCRWWDDLRFLSACRSRLERTLVAGLDRQLNPFHNITMKHRNHTLLVLLFAFSLLTLAGCGGNDPSSVVKKFYTAMEKGDTKTMLSLSTAKTHPLINLMGPEAVKEMAKEAIAEGGRIKSCTHSINGDTATVTITFTKGGTETEKLVKVDGKWKIEPDK